MSCVPCLSVTTQFVHISGAQDKLRKWTGVRPCDSVNHSSHPSEVLKVKRKWTGVRPCRAHDLGNGVGRSVAPPGVPRGGGQPQPGLLVVHPAPHVAEAHARAPGVLRRAPHFERELVVILQPRREVEAAGEVPQARALNKTSPQLSQLNLSRCEALYKPPLKLNPSKGLGVPSSAAEKEAVR